MSQSVSVSLSPSSLSVTPGATSEATVTLQNSGQAIDQFTVTLEGLDAGWFSLPVSSVALFPNDKDTLKIVFAPPTTATKGGSYPVRVRVSSQQNPAEQAFADLSLRLIASPEVGVVITPAVATGRKTHYHVSVTNPAPAEVALELKATSRDGSLKLVLASHTAKVPGAGSSEVQLDASLHWLRLFFGKKETDFEVAASVPGIPEAKTASGRLIGQRWYSFFSQIRLPWLSKPPEVASFKTATDDNREFRLSWDVKRGAEVKLDDEKVEKRGLKSVRPTEARTYVLSAANKYGSTVRKVEVRPITVPQPRTSERIRVSLSQTDLKANAGGVPVPMSVQVQNTGQIVDKFLVEVEGIDQAWYARSASSLALMPQTSAQTQILLQPPKQKPVRNGVYPFAVVVRSQTAPEEATIALAQVEVLPVVEFKAAVRPYRVTTRGKGKFRVALTNTGVSEVGLVLDATDLDEGLSFRFKEDTTSLLAWSSKEVLMLAKPRRGSIIGERKRYDITVTSRTNDGKTQTANCEMYHNPLMTSWKPIWRTIRILIALAILIVVVYYVLKWGGGWSTLTKSPQTWSNQFVKTIESWFSR